MGSLPIVSTAIDAIQHAIADVDIKVCLQDSPTAITDSKESPAPATSTGFTESAGKN